MDSFVKVFGEEFMNSVNKNGIDSEDLFLLYDLKSSTEDMSQEETDKFLKITARRMKPNQTQLGEYAFLDLFANPHFRDEFRHEMFDTIRRIKGPTLLKGFIKCFKCKSENTTSEEFSNRAADEASKMRHWCNECNNFWITQ